MSKPQRFRFNGCFRWWGKVDSNHRRRRQQIYSLSPLATREFPHIQCPLRNAYIIAQPSAVVNRFLKSLLLFCRKFFQPIFGLFLLLCCSPNLFSGIPHAPLQSSLCHAVSNPAIETKKNQANLILFRLNGGRWIRTTEGGASRFTVCPLWPLGNSPKLQ